MMEMTCSLKILLLELYRHKEKILMKIGLEKATWKQLKKLNVRVQVSDILTNIYATQKRPTLFNNTWHFIGLSLINSRKGILD